MTVAHVHAEVEKPPLSRSRRPPNRGQTVPNRGPEHT